jgi:outer membrane receptor for ferrienterochelin and colicin
VLEKPNKHRWNGRSAPKSVPSVSIDETGSASIRNLATTIYINGKPTQLTLAQIPANQIESVEVVSNPSARYDASTSGGIINLVLKKIEKQAIMVWLVSVSVTTADMMPL